MISIKQTTDKAVARNAKFPKLYVYCDIGASTDFWGSKPWIVGHMCDVSKSIFSVCGLHFSNIASDLFFSQPNCLYYSLRIPSSVQKTLKRLKNKLRISKRF